MTSCSQQTVRVQTACGLSALVCNPKKYGDVTRVLVCVHGISRNAETQLHAFAEPLADRGWLLVAPLFDPEQFSGYQRLQRGRQGVSADEALNQLLDGMFEHLGLPKQPIYLFGFSGGAQFAHRYALRHPQRVKRLSLAAAGVYTFPDVSVPYPRGLARSRHWREPLWLEGLLNIPIQVLVGEQDQLRDSALRKGSRVDQQQGKHRLQRAERWCRALQAEVRKRGLSTPVLFQRLANCGHDFEQCVVQGRLVEEVCSFIQRPLKQPQPLSGLQFAV